MKNIKKTFRGKVREYYKSYYENSDEAHLINHADDVCELALELNKNIDEKLVILASYIHDMFNRQNREKHHILAYKYVLQANDIFLKRVLPKELSMIAYAVLEHRGSFKGDFYSPLSAIISSADRGKPDIEFIIKRSMKFNKQNVKNVYKHIKSKYGTGGYAKYPYLYQEIFKDELKIFKQLVDNLTVEKILEIYYS